MNKEREIAASIKNAFRGRELVSRDELNQYFSQLNPDITPTAARNRIYHLVRYGEISAITNELYTFEVKPEWKPLNSNSIISIWDKISGEIGRNEVCLWTTKWLNEFSNLQAFNEIIFIETEEIIASYIYHKIAENYNNVYFQPDTKEVDYYISTKELSYIVRPLITRAPIVNQNRFFTAGGNKVPQIAFLSPPRPRLEKVLTDLYYNKKLMPAWESEESKIWQNAYDKYLINFSTVYNYAKRRDSSVRILTFINQSINNLPNDITRFLQEKSHS